LRRFGLAMRLLKPVEHQTKRLWDKSLAHSRWYADTLLAPWREPAALDLGRRLKGPESDNANLINVLPERGVIYIAIPKAASTRIRAILSGIGGRYSRKLNPGRWGKRREPERTSHIGFISLYRLAKNPGTFCFSFVRNPYARVLSCWSEKFQGKPLVPGLLPIIDDYLARRAQIDPKLPHGPDQTLPFESFVTFAETSAHLDVAEVHLRAQTDHLDAPGIPVEFIGRVESFNDDFAVVLDRLKASDEIRREAVTKANESTHKPWLEYYTPDLAERIYRAYESDFDRFRYPKTISK